MDIMDSLQSGFEYGWDVSCDIVETVGDAAGSATGAVAGCTMGLLWPIAQFLGYVITTVVVEPIINMVHFIYGKIEDYQEAKRNEKETLLEQRNVKSLPNLSTETSVSDPTRRLLINHLKHGDIPTADVAALFQTTQARVELWRSQAEITAQESISP